MPLLPDTRYSGTIHRAKWTGYDKQDGGRGQALKYRVKVEGHGFADGELYFSDAAAQKSYQRIQDVLGVTFTKEQFLAFMNDPAPLMQDAACSITTKLNDDGVVVVQWLNEDGGGGKPITPEDQSAIMRRLFPADPFAPADDDAPF